MFIFPVRVYYSDTDCGGIVYHARYLDFAEHARTELLRSVDESQSELREKQNLVFVVKSIAIDYQRPGRLDDSLIVETSIEEARHFSITFLQTIKRGEDTLAVLRCKVASLDCKTLRPTALPLWFVPAVERL
ncbi:MAG: tol-pal system-associated acyl-CoA thioesterase [Sphaerochaetaceae bacterium]